MMDQQAQAQAHTDRVNAFLQANPDLHKRVRRPVLYVEGPGGDMEVYELTRGMWLWANIQDILARPDPADIQRLQAKRAELVQAIADAQAALARLDVELTPPPQANGWVRQTPPAGSMTTH